MVCIAFRIVSNNSVNVHYTCEVSLVKILLCLLFAVWSGNTMWKSTQVNTWCSVNT